MRKIHITEAQLKSVLMALNEDSNDTVPVSLDTAAGIDNGIGTECKKTIDTAIKNGLPADKIQGTVKGNVIKNMEESLDEYQRHYTFGDKSFNYEGEEGWDELMSLLEDMINGDDDAKSVISNALDGDEGSFDELLNYIENVSDLQVNSNMVRQALETFKEEDTDNYRLNPDTGWFQHNPDAKPNEYKYSEVMECYTKKQIKEARLRKMMNECNTVLRKKDIKK